MKIETKRISVRVKRLLDSYLKMEAYSAGSFIMFQPKAPETLRRFKRQK